MKNLLGFIALLSSFFVSAQDFEIKTLKANYRFSFETLKRSTEKDIGLLGIGYDLFPFEKRDDVYFTFNSYSAISGDRAGVFSFGLGAGWRKAFLKDRFAIDLGAFVAGGGGGGAPDGGGLILRAHSNLFFKFDRFSIFTGVSRFDFIDGDMRSTNFNIGFTADNKFYSAKRTTNSRGGHLTNQKRLRVSGVATAYTKIHDGPVGSGHKTYDSTQTIGLFGAEIDKFINKNLYASIEINGLVRSGIDGYMSYLVGLGYQLPFLKDKMSLDAQVMGGPSGGGGMLTGGGGTLKAALALRANIYRDFELFASYGRMWAPVGNFDVDVLDFGISKNIKYYQTDGKIGTKNINLKSKNNLDEFGFEVFNRSYFPPNIKDKNGIFYDRFFNLIGFQISKNISKNFIALASTVWAYQGSYGAYGEGWVGLEYNWINTNKWRFNTRAKLGAAGGGGISLGSGLVAQYGIGSKYELTDNWELSLNAGRMQGIQGNFTPIYVDFGVKFTVFQLGLN